MKVKNSYWITSGLYSLGSKFFTLLFGFGSFYFVIRSLPPREFGTWALFLTITTIVETSRNGLIQNALIKLLHSNPEEKAVKVISASWFINIFYSIFIFALLASFSSLFGKVFESEAIGPMFLYYGVTLFLLIPFSQFNFIQQSKFSFSGIFWGAFTRQGFFFAFVLVYYFSSASLSLMNLVWIQTMGTFLGLVVSFFCARKFLHLRFEYDGDLVKKVFHFGKYVMGTNISSLLFKSTDQLMVGSFLDTSSMALYNSAIRLSNLIEYPTTSIAEVVYPKSVANFEKDGNSSSKMFFEKSVALTMALTLPIVMVTFVFADLIIFIIAGSQYAQSADILRITILFGIFTPFFRQFGTAMDSSGRPNFNFFVLIFSVLINAIFNYFGIRMFGIIGAAYGTLLSYVIISLVCSVLMIKIFRVEMINIYLYLIGYYKQAFTVARGYLTGFVTQLGHGEK